MEIEKEGVSGYCPCCGAPQYGDVPIEHDTEDGCVLMTINGRETLPSGMCF